MKRITHWRDKHLTCAFCGETRSVKYMMDVETEFGQAKEAPCCNLCVFHAQFNDFDDPFAAPKVGRVKTYLKENKGCTIGIGNIARETNLSLVKCMEALEILQKVGLVEESNKYFYQAGDKRC